MADFRRDYQITADELRAISAPEFRTLLQGLSQHSRFLNAWNKAAKHVYDPAEIAAITAAARR